MNFFSHSYSVCTFKHLVQKRHFLCLRNMSKAKTLRTPSLYSQVDTDCILWKREWKRRKGQEIKIYLFVMSRWRPHFSFIHFLRCSMCTYKKWNFFLQPFLQLRHARKERKAFHFKCKWTEHYWISIPCDLGRDFELQLEKGVLLHFHFILWWEFKCLWG